MSAALAGKFYEVHKARPFYGELTAYMSSGTIVPMILEKDNAVEDFRKLIGATDPKKAEPGTIRALFAKSIDANAIHGSDSDENAEIEGNFFFSQFRKILITKLNKPRSVGVCLLIVLIKVPILPFTYILIS